MQQFDNVGVIEPDNAELLAAIILGLLSAERVRSTKNVRKVGNEFVRENIFRSYLARAGLL